MGLIESLIRIFREGDLFPLVVAVWFAMVLAGKAANRDPWIVWKAEVTGLLVVVVWGIAVMQSGAVHSSADFLWDVVVRGALAGGMAASVACVVLGGWTLLWNGRSGIGLSDMLERFRDLFVRKQPPAPMRDYAAENAARKAELEREEERKKADQQKVADLRYGVILQYQKNQEQLQSFLTREQLDGILNEFFHKEHTVKAVRARCRQLTDMIGQLSVNVAEAEPARKSELTPCTSMDEIIDRFAQQKEVVDRQSGLDESMKAVLLDSIDEAEQAALQNFLRQV